MKTVYKYFLKIEDLQVISLPRDAKLLCVQIQNGTPCLWAQVDDQLPHEDRTICIYGTGHKIAHIGLEYIGTFQIPDLVFHVFER